MQITALPRPLATLALSGLIPFVGLAVALWLLPPTGATVALFALLAYGAVILSFLGAVHWGLALGQYQAGAATAAAAFSWARLGWAVAPALIAWVALILPPAFGLLLLAAGFALAWLVDRAVVRANQLPAWYRPLRAWLSLPVLASLGAALAWTLRAGF